MCAFPRMTPLLSAAASCLCELCRSQSSVHSVTPPPPPPLLSLLVGEGAVRWAESQSLPTSPPGQLITPEAQRRYDKYKHSLDEADGPRHPERKRPRLDVDVRRLD